MQIFSIVFLVCFTQDLLSSLFNPFFSQFYNSWDLEHCLMPMPCTSHICGLPLATRFSFWENLSSRTYPYPWLQLAAVQTSIKPHKTTSIRPHPLKLCSRFYLLGHIKKTLGDMYISLGVILHKIKLVMCNFLLKCSLAPLDLFSRKFRKYVTDLLHC